MIKHKVLALALTLVSADIAADAHYPAFAAFVSAHNRSYADTAETAYRFGIFKQTLALIDLRNAKGNERHGVTKFADLTPEEFKQRALGLVFSREGQRALRRHPRHHGADLASFGNATLAKKWGDSENRDLK